jgi:uncharacterized membrane protein
MSRYTVLVLFSFALALTFQTQSLFAQENISETKQPASEVIQAEVQNILQEYDEIIPGTETPQHVQLLSVEILEGLKKGEVVEVQNDYLAVKKGDTIFVIHDGVFGQVSRFYMQDVDRRVSLLILSLLGIFAVVAFGAWYGVRALFSLAISLVVLWQVLIPGLAKGWDPLLACFLVASFILTCMLVFTHGPNRETVIALTGTLIAVIATLGIAKLAVSMSHVSGFSMDASIFLNFNSNGAFDLVGLLIGGIVIGTLGVLDDIAITQVAVVREIKSHSPHIKPKEVFTSAMRVGREHVGAVVNTLAFAYVGVSLPLVLLLHMGNVSMRAFLNMEIIAVEILRVVVGTIGIVMTVPIVTLLAVKYITVKQGK